MHILNQHTSIGVIGPERMLGPKSIYHNFQWFWLIGAGLPVLFYLLGRMFPKSRVRHLNAPVYGSLYLSLCIYTPYLRNSTTNDKSACSVPWAGYHRPRHLISSCGRSSASCSTTTSVRDGPAGGGITTTSSLQRLIRG